MGEGVRYNESDILQLEDGAESNLEASGRMYRLIAHSALARLEEDGNRDSALERLSTRVLLTGPIIPSGDSGSIREILDIKRGGESDNPFIRISSSIQVDSSPEFFHPSSAPLPNVMFSMFIPCNDNVFFGEGVWPDEKLAEKSEFTVHRVEHNRMPEKFVAHLANAIWGWEEVQ